MSTCPYCGAETRPGDNFCLSCGHKLAGVAAQPAAAPLEPTIPAQGDWMRQAAPSFHSEGTVAASPAAPPWGAPAVAVEHGDAPTMHQDIGGATVPASTIDDPAKLILRSDNGETVQDYLLDKPEIVIGRGANCDIVLSKDKLTSRRHAIVRYENGSYILRDGGSSNGTFVNGQKIEASDARVLQNGDHIGIGEYELVFSPANVSAMPPTDIAEMQTISVPRNAMPEMTYGTQEDNHATSPTNDEFGTRTWNENAVVPEPEPAAIAPEPEPEPPAPQPEPSIVPIPAPTPQPGVTSSARRETDGEVSFSRLTSIPLPSLPDMAPILAALSSLDGQITALQEKLNTTQSGMREHEEEIVQTTNQLRAGVRNVADRMNSTIADVARTREALSWAELRQLMEDVMNNPRDIEYVTKLARRSRELNKVFLMHQDVLNTMAECYSLLRGLIGD